MSWDTDLHNMQPAQVGGRATAGYILGLGISWRETAGDLSISGNEAVQWDIQNREKNIGYIEFS